MITIKEPAAANCKISFSTPFQPFLDMQTPRMPESFLSMEEALYKHAAEIADGIILQKLTEIHADNDFVKGTIKKARCDSPFPLINKGWKDVSVLLQGGTKVLIKTPYVRKDWKKITGRNHKKRGENGSGMYPVLEALGIKDGVSPATRSEIALYTVQAASYQEAVQMLERKGLKIGTSTLARIACQTARTDISLRDAALSAAMNIPVSPDGPLAGKRVRASIDGGRTRTRITKKGRRTKKGRHRFKTAWREPRILVIDLIDEKGDYDSLRLPLYDVLIDDGEASFTMLIGYLRLLGAAYCEVFEFISDGAEWIWNRVDQMLIQSEIPESSAILVLDFYHASEHLSDAVELCKSLPKKEREKIYKKLRHILRHEPDGILKVIKELKLLGKTRRGKKMKAALNYFEAHTDHMQYALLDEMKLPVGSGQVESAVRRVINLRFKSNGTFWKEETAENLMHLRAFFKSGRWKELIIRVLTGEFKTPLFNPQQQKNGSNHISEKKNIPQYDEDLHEERMVA